MMWRFVNVLAEEKLSPRYVIKLQKAINSESIMLMSVVITCKNKKEDAKRVNKSLCN